MDEAVYRKIQQSIVGEISAERAESTSETGWINLVTECLDEIYSDIKHYAKYGFNHIRWSISNVIGNLGLAYIPEDVQNIIKEYLEKDGYKVTVMGRTSSEILYKIEWKVGY